MLLLLQLLVLLRSTTGGQATEVSQEVRLDNINVFLTMAWKVAHLVWPNSSCYVCGLMPYTAGQGLPLMAVPATDCDTCHLLHIHLPQSYSHPDCPRLPPARLLNCSGEHTNCQRCTEIPKPVPILLNPQPFHWCLENDGGVHLGKSNCRHTYKWTPGHPYGDPQTLDSPVEQCLKTAGLLHLTALAHRATSCSISSREGMYWVCGNLAYPYLPVDYNGRCGLAYVVPAMRVAHSLPSKAPGKRTRRGISDVFGTHHQTLFKNSLGALLPFYGVMSALDQISDLSHAMEVIANETGRALMLISSELASVRLLALQNRAALDFLLAAQGGTCAIIGSECCTFVPEYNATIFDIVDHLHETAKSIHQNSSSLSDWISSAFGTPSYLTFKLLFILAVFIVVFSLFSSCMKKFLFKA